MPKINIRRLDIRWQGLPAAAAREARALKPALERALAEALPLNGPQARRVQKLDLGTVQASGAEWAGKVAGKLAEKLTEKSDM